MFVDRLDDGKLNGLDKKPCDVDRSQEGFRSKRSTLALRESGSQVAKLYVYVVHVAFILLNSSLWMYNVYTYLERKV